MPDLGTVFVAANTNNGGRIRIAIEGPDDLGFIQPVILTKCNILEWGPRVIEFQNSGDIRIVLQHEMKLGGKITITNWNAACWIRVSAGGDIITGPPDRWIPQSGQPEYVTSWLNQGQLLRSSTRDPAPITSSNENSTES